MTETDFPVKLFENKRTPFYYYDLDLLDATLDAVRRYSDTPGFVVHYAVKANPNPVILSHIAAAGLGADTVSMGEVKAALEAGFTPESIVLAGVGKSDEEIEYALNVGIGCLNVESVEELEIIRDIAGRLGKVAPVALRVNPEIDAHTHHYITTGLAENKFGIDSRRLSEALDLCAASQWLELKGLHFHIGSQITDLTPYRILCERINTLAAIKDVFIPSINVGGGLGIDYDDPDACPIPDFKAYFDIFREHLQLKPGQTLHFELGRAIVGQCGSLISRVLYVKHGMSRDFVIIDAGMTELIRPALYQAHHKIVNLTPHSTECVTYDVVGPICESSDTFGTDEQLPLTSRGDLLAIRSAGAYGEAMASTYNCRRLPGVVFSNEEA